MNQYVMEPPSTRFWRKVDKRADGCWIWTGTPYSNGYGCFSVRQHKVLAHRYAYELLVGPIPDGLVVDHLCRNRACVNPDHLEPVEHRENCQRGARGRLVTVCAQGHEYTPENTYIRPYGRRDCRACKRIRSARHKQNQRAA